MIWSPTSDTQLRKQLGSDEHPIVGEQRVLIRAAVSERDVATERKRRLDRAQFDHLGHLTPALRGSHHRGHLDRVGSRSHASPREVSGDICFDTLTPWAIGRDHDVGPQQRSRFASYNQTHALNDRSQRDNRAHTNGDADEEKQQPLPGCAGLSKAHNEDETHAVPLRPAKAGRYISKASVRL